ncbi:MAG: hypothetical protein ABI867_04780 [Kofleriaceae bacterium]
MKALAIAAVLLACACSSKPKDKPADPPPPDKGSDTTMKGSDTTMKGSDAPVATGSGSGSAEPSGSGSAAPAGSGSGSDVVAASDFDFSKLSHKEQMEFMKTKVMPVMKSEFQKFDGKKYANFTCKTCHGKDPEKTKFKMPTPGAMPKLNFEKLKAGKQEPKTAEWMGKVIEPGMAKILNKPVYTESNPTGFGCLACHEQKK